MTRVTEKQRTCLKTIIECKGVMIDVGKKLNVDGSTVSNMFAELSKRHGFPRLPAQGQSQEGRDARVERATELLEIMDRSLAYATPRHPAICHPDREEYAARQCADCYHERVRRSIAGSVAKIREPKVLTPKQVEIERQLRGDDVMITWDQAEDLAETLSRARDAIDVSLKVLAKSMAKAS